MKSKSIKMVWSPFQTRKRQLNYIQKQYLKQKDSHFSDGYKMKIILFELEKNI